ncbi:MAG: RHS repeat protein [Caulobacteraceae bacterium]|nr:RHS repeat protein [Caulobacteraceae bacterium]
MTVSHRTLARRSLVIAAPSALAGAAHAGTVTYTYDGLGRLATASYSDGSTVTYKYDPAGNRTRQVTTAAGTPSAHGQARPGADRLERRHGATPGRGTAPTTTHGR